MHIPNDIRRELQSKLPQYVLSYLTDKLIELGVYCEKVKELEKEKKELHAQLHKMLTSAYDQNQSKGQFEQMGYSQHRQMRNNSQQSGDIQNYYIPDWEYYEFPEDRRYRRYDYTMRRGVPGTGRRYRYEAAEQGNNSNQSNEGGQTNNVTNDAYRRTFKQPYMPIPPEYEEIYDPPAPDPNPHK